MSKAVASIQDLWRRTTARVQGRPDTIGSGVLVVATLAMAVWFGVHMVELSEKLIYNVAVVVRMDFDYGRDYFMGVVWWIIIAVLLLAFGGQYRRMLLAAWIGRFFVALVAMLLYEQRYGLDAYSYYDVVWTGDHWMYEGSIDWHRAGILPSTKALMNPENTKQLGAGIGTENMIRTALLVASITGPFYHAMKVMFAFFGLMGSWYFYRAGAVVLGRESPPLFYLLAFFPSVIFWASIVGKEPLQLLFLGLYAYGGALWFTGGGLTALGFIGAGLFGCFLFRPWIAGLAAIALVLGTLLGKLNGRQAAVCLCAVGAVAVFWGESILELPFGDVTYGQMLVGGMMTEWLENNAQAFSGETQKAGGSGAELPDLKNDGGGAVALIMFSGIFRPLPFDITNPFTALAALENTIILGMALIALKRFRLAYLREPLVLWPLFYILMWSALFGLIVMANFGAGARYKLQMWPFLLLLLIILVTREGRAILAARAQK